MGGGFLREYKGGKLSSDLESIGLEPLPTQVVRQVTMA